MAADAHGSEGPLRRTPLYRRHLEAGGRVVPFAGWEMPLSYSGQLAEHRAVRTGVGMFDVSHMGQFMVRGAGAGAFLDYLLPGHISALRVGESRYTQLLKGDGGTLDDLIVTHLTENREFFLVVNAGTREKDFAWIKSQAEAFSGEVKVEDQSDHWAMIAVQGPESLYLLERLISPQMWSDTAPFTMHHFNWEGLPHLLSRTGYTGEKGAELLVPASLATKWWDRLMEMKVLPCGLAARDGLRLEAGYCLYGQDLDESTNPVAAGLSWSVGWKKPGDFIGRKALELVRAEGPKRRLIGLCAEGRRPLRHGEAILDPNDGRPVGEITSGGFSPAGECGIALAWVEAKFASAPLLHVDAKGRPVPVRPTKPPFAPIGLKPG